MYTGTFKWSDLLCELNEQTGICKEFPEINKNRQTK